MRPEPSPNPEARSGFQPRLEALRGLAALAVAGGHSLLVFDLTQAPVERRLVHLLTTFINGGAAVSIFFVLSGYVLGLGFRRRDPPTWMGAFIYELRRFFRIYPAVLVMLGAILLALWWHQPPAARPAANPEWFAHSYAAYDRFPSAGEIWRNASLQIFSLNEVMWTLRIELLCSALLPVLHVLFRNASRGLTILGFFLLALLPVAGLSPRSFGPMFMFFLGYLLSGSRQWDWTALVGRIRWGWIPVWIGLLAVTKLARLKSMPDPVVGVASVIEGLCAALVVARIAHGADGPWLRVLDRPFSNVLGKLSYSFYLVHFPLLFFLMEPVWSHLPSRLPPGMAVVAGFITWAISTAVALPASWVLYRLVEMPCIEIGRRLGKFEKGRRPAGTPA